MIGKCDDGDQKEFILHYIVYNHGMSQKLTISRIIRFLENAIS